VTQAAPALRLVERTKNHAIGVILFVMQDAMTSAPPSATVRSAIGKVYERFGDQGSLLIIVMVGEGFGVAIQRAATSTLATLLRPSLRVRFVVDVQTGVRDLFGPEACDDVVRLCETNLAAPSRH
jgi:hypothetical protein